VKRGFFYMRKIKYLLITKSFGFYINFLSLINIKKATFLAYKLFSNPRKGKIDKNDLPSIIKQAKIEKINYKEHAFQAYIWEGNENVILLAHGWESHVGRWKKALPHLKKEGFTIIAIDAPAHGFASGNEFNAPLYAEFINETVNKFNPFAIMAHSIGGAASIYFQHKYQNVDVKKMIVLGAPSELKIMTDNFMALLSLNKKVRKSFDDLIFSKFNIRLKNFNTHDFVKEINTKGLVIHDIGDKIVPFAEGQKIANNWKTATFIETKKLGHSLHDEKLYDKIVDFLKEN
jgi:predicted alpha/beta hydrolase family esterase